MTYTMKVAAPPVEDAVFVTTADVENATANAVGFNLERNSWKNELWGDLHRPHTTTLMGVDAVSNGGRRIAANPQGLLWGSFWTGGTAHVYRVENGVLSKVRESAITDDAHERWVHRHVFTGSSGGARFDKWERWSAPQWFAVRAYDANGDVGPLSNVVALTTPATWTEVYTSATSFVDVTSDNAPIKLTGNETGALGAPVISASWVSGEDVLSVSVDTPASGSPAGYILYISDADPATLRGAFVEVADDGGPAIQAGDLVVLSRPHPEVPTGGMAINRVYAATEGANFYKPAAVTDGTSYNNRWFTDDPDNSFSWGSESGEDFARYTITAPRAIDTWLRLPAYSGTVGTNGAIIAEGERWMVEIDARADAARVVRLAFEAAGDFSVRVVAVNGVPTTPVLADNYNITLPDTRATTTLELEWGAPPALGSRISRLYFDNAGVYDFFGIRIWQLPAGFNGLTPENKARIEAARPAFIRDHSFVKKNSLGGNYTLANLVRRYLHPSLANTLEIGCPTFWLQPELWDVNDYPLLADYLCGPTSTEYGALRASLGRTAPWTDDLEFWFELSNETWNTVRGFYNFPAMRDVADGNRLIEGHTGETYGRFSELFYQALVTRAATHGAAARFSHILGGRFNGNYGDIAARVAPSATVVTRAPYVRGWEVGASSVIDSPQGFFDTLFWPATVTLDRLADSETWLAEARANGANPTLVAGTYEDALSFSVLPSSSNPIPIGERRFVKTVAGATCYLDKIATQSALYSIQAHFTLDYGDTWSSHDRVSKRAWPYHLWLEIWNEHCAGAKRVETPFVGPRKPSISVGGTTYENVPEIGCHVLRTAAGWAVILVNRNLPYDAIDSADPLYNASDDGARTAKVLLPTGGVSGVTKYEMTGAWDAHNFDAGDPNFDATIGIVSSDASEAFAGGRLTATLAPAKAVVFVVRE